MPHLILAVYHEYFTGKKTKYLEYCSILGLVLHVISHHFATGFTFAARLRLELPRVGQIELLLHIVHAFTLHGPLPNVQHLLACLIFPIILVYLIW